MIKRYSRPEMERIWTAENEYQCWLEVELAACKAMNKVGIIPYNDLNIGEGFNEFERYDRVIEVINENNGILTEMQVIDLLSEVGIRYNNEDKLHWTVIYNLSTLEGIIFANRNTDNLIYFHLTP